MITGPFTSSFSVPLRRCALIFCVNMGLEGVLPNWECRTSPESDSSGKCTGNPGVEVAYPQMVTVEYGYQGM